MNGDANNPWRSVTQRGKIVETKEQMMRVEIARGEMSVERLNKMAAWPDSQPGVLKAVAARLRILQRNKS